MFVYQIAESGDAIGASSGADVLADDPAGRPRTGPGHRSGARTQDVTADVAAEVAVEVAASGAFGALEALIAAPADELGDGDLTALVKACERWRHRLRARVVTLTGEITARAARAAAAQDGADGRRPERAAREALHTLRQDVGWSPSEAAKVQRLGRSLVDAPDVAEALESGAIGEDQARSIVQSIGALDRGGADGPTVARVRGALLVDASDGVDAVELGRRGRRELASVTPDRAEIEAVRRHAHRSASAWQDADGYTHLRGRFSGIDAEVVLSAIDAFRTTDGPDPIDARSPAQRTADALVSALGHAMRHGERTNHGVRPHVTITIRRDEAGNDLAPPEGAWTGPLPASDVRRVCEDASITTITTDSDGVPLDVGRTRRQLPVGIWRAMVARDGGCTFDGCDAPANWCDGAHLDRRWTQGAGTSLAEQALLCRHHHRRVDRERWAGAVIDGQVRWRPPPRPPP